MKYDKFILGSIFVLMVFIIPMPANAVSLGLNWNANTESDLAGYIVYYGNTSGNYTSYRDVGNVVSCQINNVTEGKTYYVAIRSYDTSWNESAYSQEVYIYVPPVSTANTSIQLLSPTEGIVLSKPPTLSWSATSLTTFTLYMALNNGSYYIMYTGKKTSHSIALYFWKLFIPSGATLKWYVVGVGSSGQQISSVVRYFKKA
jgi:hypothetical protein